VGGNVGAGSVVSHGGASARIVWPLLFAWPPAHSFSGDGGSRRPVGAMPGGFGLGFALASEIRMGGYNPPQGGCNLSLLPVAEIYVKT